MLNSKLKKESIRKFENAKSTYEELGEEVTKKSNRLMILRKDRCYQLITKVEALFSNIANKPKTFDKTFSEYKAEYKIFTNILDRIREESRKVDYQTGGTAGAGVAAGVGVATLAPSAAMAIATTFGTASTGTAISSLTGAVATRAALAWLGGGAVAAGGGGMVAGNALLALAGPVGWAISGTTIVGSAWYARGKNEKIAKEADEKRKEIEVLNRQLKAGSLEVEKLIDETRKHIDGMENQLKILDSSLDTFDYNKLDKEQKDLMIALKNHVESLSVLMKKKIEI